MELLAVGALAYLGCRSNAEGRRQRWVADMPDLPPDPQACWTPDDFERQVADSDMYESEYRKQYLASLNPKETRVIPANVPPSQWPHYVSEAKHASESDFGKARKLEMFTGESDPYTRAVTGTQVKADGAGQSPLFGVATNAHQVNSEGKVTTLMPLEDERQRYHVSDKHNNVSPCDKIMVGPGLGLGPDVQSSGSLHQGFRILPTNVMNFNRLNRETPGRVIPGQSDILRPGTFAPFGPQKHSGLGDMTGRSLAPQRAAFTAGAPRPHPITRCTKDSTFEAFFGAPAGPPVPGVAGLSTRVKADDAPGLPIINPISLHANESGYLQAPPGDPRPTRDRPGQVLNAYIGGAPGHVTQGFCAPRTNRDANAQHNTVFASNPHVAAPPMRGGDGWRPIPTNRDKAYLEPNPYLGPATGPSGPKPPSEFSTRCTRDALLHDNTPGPQSTNAYNPDPGQFRLRQEVSASRPPVDDRSQTQGHVRIQPGAGTRCKVRNSELNPWMNAQVQDSIRRQLTDNPLWQPQA